mmetsp:Transcript_12451/g.32902  ORF Transcript_12451/g.32902 Transcript_12451/m.32902 type:complete len:242 (+) Transcript_12451:2048-2773(+)
MHEQDLKVLGVAEKLGNHARGLDLDRHVFLIQLLNVALQVLEVGWLILLLLGFEDLACGMLLPAPELCRILLHAAWVSRLECPFGSGFVLRLVRLVFLGRPRVALRLWRGRGVPCCSGAGTTSTTTTTAHSLLQLLQQALHKPHLGGMDQLAFIHYILSYGSSVGGGIQRLDRDLFVRLLPAHNLRRAIGLRCYLLNLIVHYDGCVLWMDFNSPRLDLLFNARVPHGRPQLQFKEDVSTRG